MRAVADPRELENAYGAHNYHPLPVVITEGQGVWGPTCTEGATSPLWALL